MSKDTRSSAFRESQIPAANKQTEIADAESTDEAEAQADETAPGTLYPVTEQWKRLVEERLDELGLTKADLARTIGCSKAALSQLFTSSRQSVLVPQVNRAIGWRPTASDPHLPDGYDPIDYLSESISTDLSQDPLLDLGWHTPTLIALPAKAVQDILRSVRNDLGEDLGALRRCEDEVRKAQDALEDRKREVESRNVQIAFLNRVIDAERGKRKTS